MDTTVQFQNGFHLRRIKQISNIPHSSTLHMLPKFLQFATLEQGDKKTTPNIGLMKYLKQYTSLVDLLNDSELVHVIHRNKLHM